MSAERWHQLNIAKKDVVAGVVSVTPAMAQLLLQKNIQNRRVDSRALYGYMQDVTNGTWPVNGETIKVCDDGSLGDGQHRMLATLLCEMPMRTVVVFNVTRESIDSVDRGKKRTNADRFAMRGEKDYNVLAAMTALSYEMMFGVKPTAQQVDDHFKKYEKSFRAANSCRGANIRGIGPSVQGISAAHLLALGAKKTDIISFFKTVRDREMVGKRNAARKLYEAIHPDNPIKTPPLQLTRIELVAVVCIAFVKWLHKKNVSETVVGPLPKTLAL